MHCQKCIKLCKQHQFLLLVKLIKLESIFFILFNHYLKFIWFYSMEDKIVLLLLISETRQSFFGLIWLKVKTTQTQIFQFCQTWLYNGRNVSIELSNFSTFLSTFPNWSWKWSNINFLSEILSAKLRRIRKRKEPFPTLKVYGTFMSAVSYSILHAQYFVLINFTLKLQSCAKASFSLLLILLART